MIKNLSAFVAKSSMGRAIEGVLINPEYIEATDSFKMITKKIKTGIEKPIIIKLPKGVKTFTKVGHVDNVATIETASGARYECEQVKDEWPKTEKIIPTSDPIAVLRLSPAHLKDICEAFLGEEAASITINYYGPGIPVMIRGDTQNYNGQKATDTALRVVLAPINK